MNKEEMIRTYKRYLKEGKILEFEQDRFLAVKNGRFYILHTDGEENHIDVDRARNILQDLVEKEWSEKEEEMEVNRFLDE